MDKQKLNHDYAEKLLELYMPRIFSFSVKRTNCFQDAEDLSQEIVLKVYRAACVKDIMNENAFVWSVAKNVFANYYRDKASRTIVSIDNVGEEEIKFESNILEELIKEESMQRLQKEIAYLSKLQRKIVIAFYYDGKKQHEIAEELGIPLGTVLCVRNKSIHRAPK